MDNEKEVRVQPNWLWWGKCYFQALILMWFSILLIGTTLLCPDFRSYSQGSALVFSYHQHKGQKVSVSGFTWQHGHEGPENHSKWYLPSSLWPFLCLWRTWGSNFSIFFLYQARYLVDEVKDKNGKQIDVLSWKHEGVQNLPLQENGYFLSLVIEVLSLLFCSTFLD